MNIRRLIYSKFGKNIISILLGLGLATIFRKACTDRNCMIFKAPEIEKIKIKHSNITTNVIDIKKMLFLVTKTRK